MPMAPPLLVHVPEDLDVALVEATLASLMTPGRICETDVREHLRSRDARLAIRVASSSTTVSVQMSQPMANDGPPPEGRAEQLAAGVTETLRAALDPERHLPRQTDQLEIAQLVCHAFTDAFPLSEGEDVDAVETVMPSPWSGVRTTRVSLPPWASGVTTDDSLLRSERRIPILADLIDARIAPMAFVRTHEPSPGWPGETTIRIIGGLSYVSRSLSRRDPMAALRDARRLKQLTDRGLIPMLQNDFDEGKPR
jgi:hypothetical protein